MRTSCARRIRYCGAVRTWLLAFMGVIGVAWMVVVLAIFVLRPAKSSSGNQTSPTERAKSMGQNASARAVAKAHPTDRAESGSPVSAPVISFPPASSKTLELVESIAHPETTGGVMTDEQILAWQQKLKGVVQLGSAALPAIHEFLQKNIDFDFGSGGKQVLGYPSARLAVLDALAHIGGADAVNIMSETLASSTDPRELAFLAQKLEQADPGQYQYAALDAARRALSLAVEGGLQGKDVAPLFELYQKFGDLRSAQDIEGLAGKWNFYAALALAQLPDEAGVPSLIRLATDAGNPDSGARMAALKMLAQVATQSDSARTALLDQARQGKLSAYDFAVMAPMLAGYQMLYQDSFVDSPMPGVSPTDLKKAHIPSSNQSFFTAPLGATTSEQITQRNALIDDLLKATQDPAVRQALQQAQDLLSRRSTQIAGK